jgi:hypothetical protein
MSKSSTAKVNSEIQNGINIITMKDIPYTQIPVNSILKDSIYEDNCDSNWGSSYILRKLRPKYPQSTSKRSSKSKKKKKVRFKADFIDEVLIESYKEHNLKMCYMQEEIEDNLIPLKKDCRSCIQRYCVIF